MESYCVRARNTAPDSENRIHDDQTAAAYGFRAGLVPGVTVYGYLTVPVIDRFGEDWLARGGIRARFLQPVYDGEEVVVELTGNNVTAARADGTVCATGEVFWPEDAPPSLALYPQEPLPAVRPPASAESLTPGRVLGTLYANLPSPDPAALLTLSNHVLMQNVQLGPWIHVSSEVRHFSLARAGDRLAVRAAWRSDSSAKAISSWWWTSSWLPAASGSSSKYATRRFTNFAIAPADRIEA